MADYRSSEGATQWIKQTLKMVFQAATNGPNRALALASICKNCEHFGLTACAY